MYRGSNSASKCRITRVQSRSRALLFLFSSGDDDDVGTSASANGAKHPTGTISITRSEAART